MCSQIYSTKHVEKPKCIIVLSFDRQNPGPTGIGELLSPSTAVDHCFTKLTFTRHQCYRSTCLQFEVCLIGLLKKTQTFQLLPPTNIASEDSPIGLHVFRRKLVIHRVRVRRLHLQSGGIWWHTFCGLLCFEDISAKKKGGNQLTYLSF